MHKNSRRKGQQSRKACALRESVAWPTLQPRLLAVFLPVRCRVQGLDDSFNFVIINDCSRHRDRATKSILSPPPAVLENTSGVEAMSVWEARGGLGVLAEASAPELLRPFWCLVAVRPLPCLFFLSAYVALCFSFFGACD